MASGAEVAGWAYKAGFRGDNLRKAVAVAWGESSWRTHAKNNIGAGHYGLWQISALHFNPKTVDWSNGQVNADMAADVQRRQGWQAWTVYSNNSYKLYLPRADTAIAQAESKGLIPKDDKASEAKESLVGDVTGLDFFFNSSNWVRAGLVLVGGVFIILAIYLLIKSSPASSTVTKAIRTVTK